MIMIENFNKFLGIIIRNKLYFIAILFLLILSGCNSEQVTSEEQSTNEENVNQKEQVSNFLSFISSKKDLR